MYVSTNSLLENVGQDVACLCVCDGLTCPARLHFVGCLLEHVVNPVKLGRVRESGYGMRSEPRQTGTGEGEWLRDA